jgi:hypothetical protein
MTPERKAELEAELDALLAPPPEPPKPRARVAPRLKRAAPPPPPAPEPVAEPDLPPPAPGPLWNMEWPVEGSIAFRMMPPEEQWACRQARMPKERYDRAINSVIEQSLGAQQRERAYHRALDPVGFGHWGPRDE